VKSGVKQGGPPPKAKYYLMTDSAQVARANGKEPKPDTPNGLAAYACWELWDGPGACKGARGVNKLACSRSRLESRAKEGESPVDETRLVSRTCSRVAPVT